MTRYYLHGDASETEPGAYYCDRCDLFASTAHFVTCPGNDYERYQQTHRRFKRQGKGKFHRPHNPKNLFA